MLMKKKNLLFYKFVIVQPHIKNEDFGGELKWECSRCQDLPDRRQLPLRKSSAPPLPQVLIQPAVPPPPPLRPTSPTNRLPPNVATEANKKKLPYNVSIHYLTHIYIYKSNIIYNLQNNVA